MWIIDVGTKVMGLIHPNLASDRRDFIKRERRHTVTAKIDAAHWAAVTAVSAASIFAVTVSLEPPAPRRMDQVNSDVNGAISFLGNAIV
jgi:hypothetical protein